MDKAVREGIRRYNQGFYERALETFLSADVDPVDDHELSYYLGLTYVQLGVWDEAELYLRQAIDLDFDLVRLYQVRMLLAYVLALKGEPKRAQYQLDQLVDSGYESVQVYSVYGYTCWQSGHLDEAFDYLRKAVLLDPENATALNSLGYLLAEEARELDNALRYCRKAVARQPENPLYLDSLGWAYFRNGEVDEAYAILRKALSLQEEKADGTVSEEIQAHMREVMQSRRTGG